MKKKSFLKRKNMIKTFVIVVIVALSLVSSSSMSATLNKISNTKNSSLEVIEKETSTKVEPSTGLAPKITVENPIIPIVSLPFDIMWGYIAYSSVFNEGTCYFDVENPEDITYLQDTESDDFLSGGTGYEGNWIACEYSNGALWEIDPVTGDMTYIGGGGVGLNGLATNHITNNVYGASGSDLYLVDPEDGSQELIGPFGSDVWYIIGMAFDYFGVLYGWDLNDYLWTINTSTGDATQVGPLGIDINWAQDGDYDPETGTLYLTAFTLSPNYGSYLYTCDMETGQCTLIGALGNGNTEIDASVIFFGWFVPYHDVGVTNIKCPKDGDAGEDMEVIIQVQNYGDSSEENVPVNVVISKDGIDEEYNETVLIDIGWGQTLYVEMPPWTPDDWQNTSNEYIDYKITAQTDFDYDMNTSNDQKEEWFELYFGYFHDIGCTNVSEPESGPAQTFPVNVTIKNLGQYDECCFKTYAEITELDAVSGSPLLPPEYSDFVNIGEIDAGQEMNITFNNWTPAYLAEETSGNKMYSVKAWTDLDNPQDENLDNDLFLKTIELDFFHDVGIKNIISPPSQRGLCAHQHWWYALNCSGDLVRWYPETGEMELIAPIGGMLFSQGCTLVGNILWFCDTNGNIWKVDPSTGKLTFVGNAGTGELTGLAFHEKSKVLYGCSSQCLYTINMATGKATFVGPFNQLGYYMISIDCDRDGNMYGYDFNYDQSRTYKIDLTNGHATPLGFCGISLMYGQDMDYDYDHGKMYACGFNYDTQQGELYEINLEAGHFNYLTTIPGSCYFFLFAIPYTIPERYVPLGSQDIEVIVENIGTFPESDLTCYAEIYEFITNCTNGTLVYENNITDIDLDEPLGGTEMLNFSSYNFATEGLYSLFLSIPDDDDDYPINNNVSLGIGADGTPPYSTYTLSPVTPNGDNSWYVSDITVTLNAADPSIGCDMDGSGVREIKYTISNGASGSVQGDTGTFKIHNDGTNIEVKYWSIDNVGNAETKHTFYINMDQTKPSVPEGIAYSYEKVGGYWYITFNVISTDATSGMERIEWAINDVVQNITKGSGPTYTWTIQWSSTFHSSGITFKATAYDKAGNSDFVKIKGSDVNAQSYPYQQCQQSQQYLNKQNLLGNLMHQQMVKTSKTMNR